MPHRKIPLVTGEVYHLFSRGVAKVPIFTDKRSYDRFAKTITYYKFADCPTKLSHFLPLSRENRIAIEQKLLTKGKKLVELICYCMMPNHFHLLVKQQVDAGISEYMRKVNHSYTKYFNTRRDRVGSLLQGPFKSVHIESDEQLIHVSRYIHINPYIGNVVTRNRLSNYPYSSLSEYLKPPRMSFIDKDLIARFFHTPREYRKFVFDEADYQKSKETIGHLTLE